MKIYSKQYYSFQSRKVHLSSMFLKKSLIGQKMIKISLGDIESSKITQGYLFLQTKEKMVFKQPVTIS